MSRPLLIFSQSDYLIQIVDTNSQTSRQTMQIQIIWLRQIDLALHRLQNQGISGSAGQGLTQCRLFSYCVVIATVSNSLSWSFTAHSTLLT